MIKNAFTSILVLSLILIGGCSEPKQAVDATAIKLIEEMSKEIDKLKTLSVTIVAEVSDSTVPKGSSIKRRTNLYARHGGMLHLNVDGEDYRRGLWFDGKLVQAFDYDTKGYQSVEFVGNSIEMIDYVHNTYGHEFPAADFFYPNLVDDIIAHYSSVEMKSNRTVDGIEENVILLTDSVESIQISIAVLSKLPTGMAVTRLSDKKRLYSARFEKWKNNTAIKEEMFVFTMPPDAVWSDSLLGRNRR